LDEGEEVERPAIVSGCETPDVFEFVEAALDYLGGRVVGDCGFLASVRWDQSVRRSQALSARIAPKSHCAENGRKENDRKSEI
jgi:hypothetical protein